MPILNMNHTSIRVKDLNKAYQFYKEVLGLPVVRIIGSEKDPRLVFLEGIELSKSENKEELGFSHLGLEVENIEEVCKDLTKKGVNFESTLRDIEFKEEGKAVKIIFFKDPDGNRVELVEWRDL